MISRSFLHSLTLLVLHILLIGNMLVLIKITYCRDGQMIWLEGHFVKATCSGWIDRFTWRCSGPALADVGPNARPKHGAPLNSHFMTSSCCSRANITSTTYEPNLRDKIEIKSGKTAIQLLGRTNTKKWLDSY